MPKSAIQHRVSAGAYQNKLHDNIRRSSTTQAQGINPGRSTIPDEIHHLGSSINRAVNSYEELSRPSRQITSSRQGVAAQVLMLLSQVRLAENPVVAADRTTASGSEIKLPVSESVEQSYNDNNFLSTLRDSIPQTLSRVDDFMLQHDPLRFPEASALPAGGYQDKKTNRFPRHVVFEKKTTTTPSPVPNDVKIEKLDFSCIEERQDLSISDVLRQIGKTFSNPISELAKESQVIAYYNKYHRCPTLEERNNLVSITSAVDQTISMITALLPGSQPLVVTQRVGGPLFRMIADDIDNKQLNIDDLSEVNGQLFALAKSIVNTSPQNLKGQTIEDQLSVPEGLFFKNNKLSVNIKGIDGEFLIENGNYFANINSKHRRISYSSESKGWARTYRYIKTSGDNIYFQHHIGKLLSGCIDKKTHVSIGQNQHGIYTLASIRFTEFFHAIKISNKFYRYIPENEKNVSLGGVIKTDNADIKVSRFDKKYFLVNEKKKMLANYSPCRLGRSPGSSCLHLSEGLINKLEENRKSGILERKIQGLKPSEKQPGLYESAEGVLYLKHDNAYFKLIKLEHGVADSQFMVTGEKRFGSKEITAICFSRTQGSNYINTPQENMMESAGVSSAEAMSHIETSSKMQPVIIEKATDLKTSNPSEKLSKMSEFKISGQNKDLLFPEYGVHLENKQPDLIDYAEKFAQLTTPEKESICTWTMKPSNDEIPDSLTLNMYLRDEMKLPDKLNTLDKNLLSALSKDLPKKNGDVIRFEQYFSDEINPWLNGKLQVGDYLNDKGYLSFSGKDNLVRNVMMKNIKTQNKELTCHIFYRVRNANNGFYLPEDIATKGKNVDEVLYSKGQVFKIKEISIALSNKAGEPDRVAVDLEEVKLDKTMPVNIGNWHTGKIEKVDRPASFSLSLTDLLESGPSVPKKGRQQ